MFAWFSSAQQTAIIQYSEIRKAKWFDLLVLDESDDYLIASRGTNIELTLYDAISLVAIKDFHVKEIQNILDDNYPNAKVAGISLFELIVSIRKLIFFFCL